MSLTKKNTKKLMDELEKNKGQPLNIGIQVSRKNPKIDYYCDKCEKPISQYQYRKGKGVCKSCH